MLNCIKRSLVSVVYIFILIEKVGRIFFELQYSGHLYFMTTNRLRITNLQKQIAHFLQTD